MLLEAGLDGEPADVDDDRDDDEPPFATVDANRGRVRVAQAPPGVHQAWTLPGGTVVFEVRLDRPLPEGVFARVGAVVERVRRFADEFQQRRTVLD